MRIILTVQKPFSGVKASFIYSWMSKLSFLFILFISFSSQLNAQHDLSVGQVIDVDSAGVLGTL